MFEPTADLGAIETATVSDATTDPTPASVAPVETLVPPRAEETAEGELPDETEERPVEQPTPPGLVEDEFDIKPDKIEGRQFFFRDTKAKQLLADHDFVRSLDTAIPGATVETIQQHYMRSLGAQQMLDDFNSGNPDQIGRWLDFHVGEQTNPQSIAAMASGMMRRLPQIAPQVYAHVRNEVVNSEVQSMYERAVRGGDEKLLTLAQNLDFHLTGGFKTVEDLRQRDPFQAERERFEQEKRQFRDERENDRRTWIEAQLSQADEQVSQAQREEIEAALAPVAESLKGKPQWSYMIHELAQKVEEAKKSNPGFMREYEILRQRVKQSPSAESKAALADKMRTFVKRAVAPHRKAVIDAVAQPVLNASAQATQNAQAAAERREPSGGGKPVNPTTDLAKRAKELREKGGGVEDIMALAR